ncbi:hypothetical protein F2Q70_00025261 [Brassica cretica]|uniref:Uncharacterized protein n=1 Tax=Brassica cretica TaxID=69181 RepID=A0A8S9LDV7_BRACR|nr:hypothetical protein F2Q70_00025261 [Brassica cretica]
MKPRARGKTTQEALEGFGWRAQHAGSGASREGTTLPPVDAKTPSGTRSCSRRQWGCTEAVKTNQSLSKLKLTNTAKIHLYSSYLKFRGP